MRLELNLLPINGHSKPLRFGWDVATGQLWGPDAVLVRRLVAAAVFDGSVGIDPVSCSYPVTDPLRCATEMAAILGNRWQLTEDLQRFYPRVAAAAPHAGDGYEIF